MADPLPAVAFTAVGAAGTVGAVGVTALELAEGGPVPTALVAVTTKVYVVPLVNPLTVAIVAGSTAAAMPIMAWVVMMQLYSVNSCVVTDGRALA